MKLTVGQAVVRFLAAQRSERDGVQHRLFEGCFGIFGHGNVAGLGQALLEAELDTPGALPYRQARNEQGMVHAAAGFARMRNRLSTLACTTSIGPGATNMVTGAALATVNRLPVLLLPGDVFATRVADPVLQQLEDPRAGDVSVNDALRPVSRYFDRIWRPEQLPAALLAAMRVLTDPADTGAVTLALPQDVQAQAHDWPEQLFQPRVWPVARPVPEPAALGRAVAVLRSARRPLIVAGGGVIYAEATDALRRFAEATGIPVAETQAGKGSLPYDHPLALGAIGATGTTAANEIAREADVVLGVGTRWSDFTTASRSAFAAGGVRFVNVNVAAFDSVKHAGVAVTADARETLAALTEALCGYAHGRGLPAARRRAGRGLGSHRRGRLPPRPLAAARAVRGDRRGQRRLRAPRRGRLRGRLDAGRPAQAVAHPRPEGLPRRIRLLVHGLRDRRRARGQAGRARPRRVRAGRRRLLPDDGPGAGHRRPGADQADRGAGAEPRIRLDRAAVRVGRRPAVRHRLPVPLRRRAARRRRAAGRPRGQRAEPGRRRHPRAHR